MPSEKYDFACAFTVMDGAEGILVTGGNSLNNPYQAETAFLDWQTQQWTILSMISLKLFMCKRCTPSSD